MQHDEQERERIELARELLPRKERDVEFEWVDCLIWCLLKEGQHEAKAVCVSLPSAQPHAPQLPLAPHSRPPD